MNRKLRGTMPGEAFFSEAMGLEISRLFPARNREYWFTENSAELLHPISTRMEELMWPYPKTPPLRNYSVM
jgi:hypothetical protein